MLFGASLQKLAYLAYPSAFQCLPCLFLARAGNAMESEEVFETCLSILVKYRGVAWLDSSTVCEIVRQSFVLICSQAHAILAN